MERPDLEFAASVVETVRSVRCYDRSGLEVPPSSALHDLLRVLRQIRDDPRPVKVVLFGNGGSCAIASHLATDLAIRGIAAVPLDSGPIITAAANDYGYEESYATQLRSLVGDDDLVIAVSSSGLSPNMIRAVQVLRDRGPRVLTISGMTEPSALSEVGWLNIVTNAPSYGDAEVAHLLILHSVITRVDEETRHHHDGDERLPADSI